MPTLKWIHRGSSLLATLLIAIFFTATLLTEVSGNLETITRVKRLIVLPGLVLLIPTIAASGLSGKRMALKRSGRMLKREWRRSLIVTLTGLFILLPTALRLRHLALSDNFGPQFYVVQVIELLAGASNLSLMGLNIHNGMKLSGRSRARISAVEAQ